MSKPTTEADWSIEAARELYHIDRWGDGYFDINEAGRVVARPLQETGASVAIMDIVEEARSRGLNPPLLIRFQDIVRHRVEAINRAFAAAIADCDYQGRYRGVFPVKVNQLREVVEEILDAGKPYDFGLEVGSKPELFAGLALQEQEGSLIVCNGYKDAAFIRMALMGLRLGKAVILVVEKLEELRQILELSRECGVKPLLGLRVRLLSKGGGRWADSGGEDAKFGLSTIELLEAARMLEEAGLKDSLKLIHFHIGSQVPEILLVKKAVQEAARFYAKLYQKGFPIQYLDVGGGLGVDYVGSRAPTESSTNYNLQEYANDVIYYVAGVCNAEKVPHPDIISESGRAIVAQHCLLVVEAFASIAKTTPPPELLEFGDHEHALVSELLEIRDQFPHLNPLEAIHDASERRDDAQDLFTLGMLSLEDKARIEHLYWEIAARVVRHFKSQRYIPEEIRKLEDSLGDQYLCNFSVFQSLLDHWALGQLFPIMPLDRLDERPTREATLVDITCDSDGQVRQFIELEEPRDTLPLHALERNGAGEAAPYHLGLFMIGAYQDIMGDLHNLFGRVNEVHVFLDPDEDSGYYLEETIKGTTIVEALSAVQYDQKELKRQLRSQIDRAIKANRLKPSEGMRMLADYERRLREYTYLAFR